jgi:hypothetical protein
MTIQFFTLSFYKKLKSYTWFIYKLYIIFLLISFTNYLFKILLFTNIISILPHILTLIITLRFVITFLQRSLNKNLIVFMEQR